MENETPEHFAESVYGVKFDYVSGMAPGYVGPLYIIHGDSLSEPMVLARKDNHLLVV
jgi:hypothetical protein